MTDHDPSPVGAILALAFATDETAARYWLAECARRGVEQPALDDMWAEWSADHTPQTIRTEDQP